MTVVKTQPKSAYPSMADVTPEMIKEWKEKYGAVFKYEAEDGKAAIFRQPDRKIVGLSSSAPDNVAGNETIAKNCFLAGDECIINDDSYFYGLSPHLQKFLKAKAGKSEEL